MIIRFKYILALFIFLPALLKGQEVNFFGEFSSSSNINPKGQTPFWLWANHLGQVPQELEFGQSAEVTIKMQGEIRGKNSYYLGTRMFGISSNDSHLEFTELYGGFNFGKIFLNVGAKTDSVIFNGLSSSNGNFLNSGNARPYPSVSVGTNEFIQIGNRNLYFSGKWEETVLFEDRVVEKPRLHHKNLFFRFGDTRLFQFELGVDHYAFWGGISESWGEQPTRFSDYLRAITAIRGSAEHTIPDQQNVSGNSVGQYLFIFRKNWDAFNAELRVAHPFELKSGMLFQNGVDNLYSIGFYFKNQQFLQNLLFEFIYSRNQDADDTADGVDYYFNHFLYASGFTYKGFVIGVPLFYPLLKNEDGVVTRITNNMITAYHFGASGKIFNPVEWKIMLTYSENYGSIVSTYDTVKSQLSCLGSLQVDFMNIPIYVSAAIAWDKGDNLYENEDENLGFRITLGGYLR